jgi:HEAT repeat protein
VAIVSILLSAALLAAPAAPEPSAEEVRARVRALLGAIDRPVPADAFRRLGPAGEDALAEVARSNDFPAFRARALGALAAIGAPAARELHQQLAADASEPGPVRRAAVRGLGRLLEGDGAAAALRPILEGDRDPSVRATAALALARAAPADGCAAIRLQAAREQGATRTAFRRAIAACERR